MKGTVASLVTTSLRSLGHVLQPIVSRFGFGFRDAPPRAPERSLPSDGRPRNRLAAARPERVASLTILPAPVGPESLSENGVVYKVAHKEHERTGAFRLVYQAYVEAGLMRQNVFQMRVMPHHLLPTTATFVALRGARVVGSVTLVGDGRLGLPMDGAFGAEVDALRSPSTWLGEVSALACAPGEDESNFEVVIGLMRLMAQFARRHGMEHLLVAVHPRHARFYRRAMGFQRLGEERPYPSVCNRPAVALQLGLWTLEGAPAENVRLFFGEPIADEHLRFCPISAAERRLFAPAAAYDTSLPEISAPAKTLACA